MGIISTSLIKRSVKFFVTTILLGIILPGIVTSVSAATKTWVGTTASTPWTTTTNWSGGTIPVAGDDVVIGGTATTTITAVPSISLASLTVNSGGGASVTLTGAAANTITITGTGSNVLSINNSLTLSSLSITLNGQLSATGQLASTKVFTIGANTFTWNSGGTFTNNSTAANLTASTGTINFNYSGGQTVPALSITGTGKLVLAGSGTKALNISISIGATSTLSIGGTATTSGIAPTYASGATIEYAGTSAQTVSTTEWSLSTTTNNLIVNNTSGLDLGSGSRTVAGLTFTNGKLSIGANTLTVNGAIGGTMSATKCFTGSSSSNLTLATGGVMGTLFFDQTSAATRTLNNFTINRSAQTATLGASNSLIIAGTLTITAGTLALGANTLTLNGSGACFTNAGTFNSNTSTVIYSGTGAQTVLGVNYYNLTIDGDRSFADITLGAGTIGVANVLSLSYFNVSNIVNTGNKVSFNGGVAQTIPLSAFTGFFRDLDVNNTHISGVTAGVSGGSNLSIKGNLSVTSGRLNDGGNQLVFSTAASTITLGASTFLQLGTSSFPTDYPTTNVGTHSLNATSTVEYNSINAQDISNVPTYGHLSLTNTALTVTKRLIGNTTLNGVLSVAANNTLNLRTFNLTINGGTSPVNNSGTIGGTSAGSATIILAGTNSQSNVTNAGTFSPLFNLSVTNTNAGGVGLGGSNFSVQNFSIASGSIFNLVNQTLPIAGTYSNLGTLNGNGGTTGTLEFNGAGGAQTLAIGTYTGSLLNRLKVNNASGLTLAAPLNVNATTTPLILTSGVLNTDATNILTITSTGAIGGTPGTTSYVNGPMQRTVPASQASTIYLFPLGKSANYNPIEFTATGGAGGATVIKAEVFNADPAGTNGTGFSAAAFLNRHWLASVTGTNNLAALTSVRLTDPSQFPTSSNLAIGFSSSGVGGTYNTIGGSSQNSPVNTITSGVALTTALGGDYKIGTKDCLNGPTYYIPGDFASITAAANALAGSVVCNNLTFKLKNTYTTAGETFPISFGAFTYGSGGPFTVTFEPDGATSASPVITASNATAVLDLNDATYVIFDGRRDGAGTTPAMTISNTGTGPTIRFINDATNNAVQYTTVTGVNTSVTSGVIVLGTTTGTTGNDYNTIDHCNINAGGGANIATNMIYAAGTSTKENDHNYITNNNISDFFLSSNSSAGVFVSTFNNTTFIQNNRLFQTATRTTGTASVHQYGILINNTNAGLGGFDVSGNTIGYANAAGTGVTTYTSATTAQLTGIYLFLSAGATNATTINNNIIAGLSHTTTTSSTAQEGVFSAIYVREGAATLAGNRIGTATDPVTVTVNTNGAGAAYAIKSDATAGITINNDNRVVNFIANGGTGTNVSINAYGINVTAGNTVIDGNRIGTTALQANHSGTSNSAILAGITATNSASYSVSITNNEIYNLSNNNSTTGTSARVAGILASGGAQYTVTGNLVHDLATAAQNSGSTTLAAVTGISINSSNTQVQKITGNTIYALKNTSAVATTTIGVYFSAGTSTSNEVAKNIIYNLQVGSSAISTIIGIHLSGNPVTASNNMVRLGYDATGAALTNPCFITGILKDNTSANNIYYNSVYIGGTGVGTTVSNTYAFRRLQTGASDNVRNNIFVNARNNATTGGKHYALYLNAVTTLVEDYNLLYASGTGTVMASMNGTDQTTIAAWRSANAGLDNNSVSDNPQFVDATGTTPNLKLNTGVATGAESGGIAIAGLTDDFEATNVRTGYPLGLPQGGTAPDLGADEANLIPKDLIAPAITVSTVTPLNVSCGTSQTVTITATVTDAGGVATSTLAPTLWWRLSTGTYASLLPSSVSGSTYTYSLNLTGLAAGQTYHYYVAAQDIASPANIGYSSGAPVHADVSTAPTTINAAPSTFTVASTIPLSGTVTVGTGGTYTTFNGASGLFTAINTNGLSGNLTVNVISDVLESTTTGLNQVAYYCGGPYTVTIQSSTTTLRTIMSAAGNLTTALIQFNGADNILVEGNSGGSGRYLAFKNSNSTTGMAFQFLNDASNITIQNCDIQALGSTTNAAVISIGTATTTGNNNITINNNLVHDLSSGFYPLNAIYSSGTAGAPNNNINITNNEIYNFSCFGGGNGRRAYGINVTATGNGSNWNISGNSFYCTFIDGSGLQSAISFLPGSASANNSISNNWIGGKSANGGAANTPWQNSYDNFSSGENQGVGMDVNAGAVTINGNNITNILWSNGDYSGYVCMHILGSTVATITNNNFGTGSGGNPDGTKMIKVSGGGVSLGSAPGYIYGIWNQSTSTAMATYTGNNFFYLWQAGGCSSCTGGNVQCIAHQAAGPATITNNVINGAQGAGYGYNQYGIRVEPSASTTGNLIERNLVAGPYVNGAGAGNGVTNTGIYVRALGTNTVSGAIKRNVIWDMRSAEVEGYTVGMYILASSGGNGNWDITNNQITLKNNGNTGVPVGLYGMDIELNSASTTNIEYNTVYISGSNGGSPAYGYDFSSYGFYRLPNGSGTVTGDVANLRNNIFINTRIVSNALTTGHFAIANIGSSAGTNWNVSTNNFLATGNGSKSYVGYWLNATKATLADWQTASGKDAASYSATYTSGASNFAGGTLNPDNMFISPLGDVHIKTTDGQSYQFVSNRGTVTSTTTDYDGDARTSTPDLGADEFFVCTTPVVSSNTPTNPTCLGGNGSIALSGLTASTTYGVTYNKNGTPVASANFTTNGSGVLTIGSLGAGAYNNFVVTIAAGCASAAYPSSGNITLTDPVTPTVSSNTPTNPTCVGGDGSIALSGLANSTAYSVTYNKNGTPVAAANFTSNGSGVVTISSLTNGAYDNFVLTPVGGCASTAYPSSGNITLTNPVTPTVSSNTPTQPTCLGGGNDGSIALSGLANSTVYSVSYSKNGTPVAAANFTSNGSGVVTVGSLSAGAYTDFVLTPVGGCASTAYPSSGNITLTAPVCGANTWQGDVIGSVNDWFNAGNWSNNVVPNSCSADAVIPTSPIGGNNFPILNASSASVGNITVQDGATIAINSGRTLSVCGNWTGGTTSPSTVTGTGSVILTGSTAQAVSGRTAFTTLHVTKTGGSTATLQANSFIDVTTAVELESGTLATGTGTLTFKSTSTTQIAVLDNFTAGYTGTLTGNITAERYYNATGTTNQHYMGSPVSTTLSQFGAGSSSGFVTPTATCSETQLASTSVYGSVFSYDQANGASCSLAGWKVEAGATAVAAAKGFAVTKNGAGTVTVTGAPNLGSSYTQAGTNSGWSNSSLQGRPMTAGWVLVSNPYLAYLDFSTQGAPANFTSEVKVWRTTGAFAGTYQDLQAGEMIAPFQGFFVHSSATGSYPISGAKRTRSTAGSFHAQANDQQLSITAANTTTGLADITMVAFNNDATTQFDNDYDAQKIAGTLGRHTLYTVGANNLWMSKNILHSITETSTVTMGFEPEVSGSYTFSFEGLSSFDPTSYITLEDRKLNTFYDVRNGDYSFTADSADQWERFVLHFTPAAQITTTDENCNALGNIIVTQPGTANWNYTITDHNNATIASGTLNETTPINAAAQTGTYVITLVDNNNYTVAKTVTVSGTSPVAAVFTPSVTVAETNQAVSFNSSSVATNYYWDFGDGTTATGQNAIHNYSDTGTYTVTLIVMSEGGCSSTTTQTITVNQTATGITTLNNKTAINIWSNENKVYIDFSQMAKTDATIAIYNVLGQELVNEKFARSTIYNKALLNTEAAYVIVKVKNGDVVITKKVFIANVK